MLTGVCLNPCIDWMLDIPSFTHGGMNRVTGAHSYSSGKGYNVARVVSRLGLPTAATGFIYTENGMGILKAMEEDGVLADCILESGMIRVNIKLHDKKSNAITEVNQPGRRITPDLFERVMKKVLGLANQSDCVVLAGSLPPGCAPNTYAGMIERIAPLGVKCVIDAEGKTLQESIRAKPFLVKPNRSELEGALGKKLKTREDVIAAAKELIAVGVSLALVSLGREGAVLTDGKETYFAPALDTPVVNTVGAGDCMLGGLLSGLLRNRPLPECFRLAAACAAVSVAGDGIVDVDYDSVTAMLPNIRLVEC